MASFFRVNYTAETKGRFVAEQKDNGNDRLIMFTKLASGLQSNY